MPFDGESVVPVPAPLADAERRRLWPAAQNGNGERGVSGTEGMRKTEEVAEVGGAEE